MSIANAEAIEAWNTVLYDKFLRFRDTLTTGFSVHGHAVLERFPPRPGSRVLDVGCGFGDTTLDIAKRLGEAGEAIGVDAASRFIEVARRDAAAAGVPNVRFEVADVQTGGGRRRRRDRRFTAPRSPSPQRRVSRPSPGRALPSQGSPTKPWGS
jgi:ubiquinone/menaquinone biosynthesis C-methylase UbiE